MAASKTRGYLLPPGEAFTDELACALVYFPDKPEYRRALRGALDYMATWTAWELDDDKRGRDAARAWKLANELTQECIEMGVCLEDLIAAVNNLQTTVSVDCFCDSITIEPPGTLPAPIIPGIGPVPTEYGEDDTTGLTWPEYQQYICAQAHAYVDYLKSQNSHLLDILNLGILALGVVAAIIAVMSGFGIAVVISLGTAAAIFQQLIASPGASVFANVNDEIEARREDIVDAIVCANGTLRSVMQSAIGIFAWDLFYQWVNWEAATIVLRTGKWEGETLEHIDPNLECECESQYFQLVYHFEDSEVPWGLVNAAYDATFEAIRGQMDDTGGHPRFGLGRDEINTELGRPITSPFEIVSVEMGYNNSSVQACLLNNVDVAINTNLTGTTAVQESLSGIGDSVVIMNAPEEPIAFLSASDFVQGNMFRAGSSGCPGGGTFVYCAWVIITGRTFST